MPSNSDAYLKKNCRYCETPLGKPFLDLGDMPLANSYVKPADADQPEFTCPLALVLCPHCRLVQLSHVVPPDLMFRHYLYVSSTTQTFRDHFAAYAHSVRGKLGGADKPLAVDIGSNDGLLLSCYQGEGMRAVGVDPAKNLSDAANARGLRTLNRYFDKDAVDEILREHGKAHAISGNNVFAHIDDIHGVLTNVSRLLDDQGLFVIEFPYLLTMLDELLFDMIYHEHLSYIGVGALSHVLERFRMEIFHVDEVSSHGGSLRVFIQKQGGPHAKTAAPARLLERESKAGLGEARAYEQFAAKVLKVREEFQALVREARSRGQKVAGYGAPAKASTLVNFYDLGLRDIDYVVDDNPLKQGYLVPGKKIPIVPSSRLQTETPQVLIIFAWNFAREILKKIGSLEREKGVRFVLPLPGPQTAASAGTVKNRFEISASEPNLSGSRS